MGSSYLRALLLLGLGRAPAAAAGPAVEPAAAQQATTHELISLAGVRARAAAWPHITIEPVSEGPTQVFILRSLLRQQEVGEIMEMAQQEWATNLREPRGTHTGIVSLDRSQKMNNSAVMVALNDRLATLSGVTPEHVEEGYFTVYNPGYSADHLHVDNHQRAMFPRRSVSFVISLESPLGEGEVLPCGQTVFPLLGASPAGSGGAVDASDLASWNKELQHSWKTFKLGDDVQMLRICGQSSGGGFQGKVCEKTWERSYDLCSRGGPNAVRLRVGDAVMFSNMNEKDSLTAETIHGSCGVSERLPKPKIVLSKFLREGPRRLWSSQSEMDRALEAMKQRKKASGSAHPQSEL